MTNYISLKQQLSMIASLVDKMEKDHPLLAHCQKEVKQLQKALDRGDTKIALSLAESLNLMLSEYITSTVGDTLP